MSNVVPIPARAPLFAEPAGRPGDWWEPVPERAAATSALIGEANRRRLPIDLLVALLVEHSTICRDIVECAIDARSAAELLERACQPSAASGPGRLNTPYIRMLRTGDARFEPESAAQLARRDLLLPLRLHGAASQLPVAEVCSSGALDDALRWEAAAAADGQFMREWALRLLLAEGAK
jgi:hypothetical protein